MTKYYITDLSLNDDEIEQKEVCRAEFYESMIYNIDVAIDFQDITSYDGLQMLKVAFMSDMNNVHFNESFNGFEYEIRKI